MLQGLSRLVLVVFSLFIAVIVIFLWTTSTRLLTPNHRELEARHLTLLETPEEHGISLEPFTVTTHDGVSLSAFLVEPSPHPGLAAKTKAVAALLTHPHQPGDPIRGTLFILHGRSGMKEDMLSIAERFVAGGYRCIVYDARCHGESGGHACTYGHHEVEDFAAVREASFARLRDRGESPGQVCALGISLGASVILQSLSTDPGLDAVVAIAPFASLPEIVYRNAKNNIYSHIPRSLIAGTMRLGGLRGGFNPYSILPIKGAKASETPIFFVHGALDRVIPPEHSERLHDAARGTTKLRIVPEGDHRNVLAKGGSHLYAEMIQFCLAAATDQKG